MFCIISIAEVLISYKNVTNMFPVKEQIMQDTNNIDFYTEDIEPDYSAFKP